MIVKEVAGKEECQPEENQGLGTENRMSPLGTECIIEKEDQSNQEVNSEEMEESSPDTGSSQETLAMEVEEEKMLVYNEGLINQKTRTHPEVMVKKESYNPGQG